MKFKFKLNDKFKQVLFVQAIQINNNSSPPLNFGITYRAPHKIFSFCFILYYSNECLQTFYAYKWRRQGMGELTGWCLMHDGSGAPHKFLLLFGFCFKPFLRVFTDVLHLRVMMGVAGWETGCSLRQDIKDSSSFKNQLREYKP